jgi:hypothetical protein
MLTNVTLFTDQGIPTLSFNVYLTGYDIAPIDLRMLFFGGLAAHTASAGQDPSGNISPQGNYSQDINFASCNGDLPFAPYNEKRLAYLRQAHTGKPVEQWSGVCAGRDYDDAVPKAGIQRRPVGTARRIDDRIPALRHATDQRRRPRRGHERDRQQQCSRHGCDDRERHGREHPSLDPRESEERQVDDHDDQLPEHGRPQHLGRGARHERQALLERQPPAEIALASRQAANAALHDDDGAIDLLAARECHGGRG